LFRCSQDFGHGGSKRIELRVERLEIAGQELDGLAALALIRVATLLSRSI
jgi:hypothetical protein